MRPSGVAAQVPLVWGHDAVAHLPGQVQAPAVLFQLVHHPQTLHIMPESLRAELVQRALPCVAKGRVPQVMGQADGLGQILVETQGAGNGASDLRHLQRVGEPGAVEVALRREKYLRFLLEPPERFAVDDPVTVPLEHRTDRVLLFGPHPAPAGIAECCPGGQGQPLDLFGALSYIHQEPSLSVFSPSSRTAQPIPMPRLRQV